MKCKVNPILENIFFENRLDDAEPLESSEIPRFTQ